MRIDQIEPLDSIESITDGASSRRNQLLVDLGSELNLGAIDGAAEADLAGLKATGDQAGPHLQALRPSAFRRDQRSAAHGARPVRQAAGRTSPSGSRRPGSSATAGSSTSRSRWRWAPARAPASAAAASAACTTVRWPTPRPSTRSSTPPSRRWRARRGVAVSLPSAAGGAAAAWWTPPRWASSPNRSPAATACWPRRPA